MRPADSQQRFRALDTSRSCIVQAPAGSGKTELLTRRFLRLLATAGRPEQVLAITFTRKATQEMRERILGRLEQAAHGVRAEAGHEAEAIRDAQAALTRDRRLGWNLRRNPARLQIHTIDGLCARIAGRHPGFAHRLADMAVTGDATRLYRKAAEGMIQDLGWRGGLDDARDALVRVLSRFHGDTGRLVDLVAQMLPRRDQWLGGIGVPVAGVQDVFAACQRLEVEHLAALLGASGLEKLEEVLEVSPPAAAAPSAPESRVRWLRGILGPVTSSRSELYKPSSAGRVLAADAPDREARVAALRGVLARWNDDPEARAAVARFMRSPPLEEGAPDPAILDDLCGLLRLAVAELEVLFVSEGRADFLYIADLAMRALGRDPDPGEALLIEDTKLAHILMDEFQDTSYAQFGMLERLVSGWQPGDGRTLFLVGDPMQSIYRFRQAEVNLFGSVFREARLGGVALEALTLSSNFRSRSELIDWVNGQFPDVFGRHPGPGDCGVRYAPVTAERGPGGSVAPFAWHESEGDGGEARRIAALVGERLAADPQADIAILARTRAQLAPIAGALKESGLRFEAVEAEALDGRPVVMDLLAFTRALAHPCDRVAWLALLRGPWCGLEVAELHAVCGDDPDADLLERMNRPEVLRGLPAARAKRVARLGLVMSGLCARAGTLPLHRQVELAWLGSRALYAAGSAEELENAQRFFDLLEKAESESPEDPLPLLAESLGKAYSASCGAGVRLMTIHKAKGLEFDVVILPGLHQPPRNPLRPLLRLHEWVHGEGSGVMMAPMDRPGFEGASLYRYLGLLEREAELDEARRILYVAATRARRELILSGAWKETGARGKRVPGCAAHSFMDMLWPCFLDVLDPVEASGRVAQPEPPAPPLRPLLRLHQEPASVLPGEFGPPAAEPFELGVPDTDAVALGQAMHFWLQLMHDHPERGWERGWFAAHRQSLHASLRRAGASEFRLSGLGARLAGMLEAVLNSPFARSVVSPEGKAGSWAELALVRREGFCLRRRVLDRLFGTESGEFHLVDYKTGRGAGESEEAWRRQLDDYAGLAADGMGVEIAKRLILHLGADGSEPALVELA